MRVHRKLMALEAQTSDLLHALDFTDSAVAICDGRGKVQVLSPSAERLLARDDGLTTRGAHLVATEERCHGALGRAMLAATQLTEEKSTPAPLPVSVSRPSGGRPYELLLCPLARRHGSARSLGGRVLVFIADPDALEPTDGELLARRFGLTPKEARVLQLLQLGHSTDDVGEQLGIGKETVRTHLKSLFSKTGTRSQVQLIVKALRGLGQLRSRRPGGER
jgi:DNA-binding CsgD family transcriptional regulator